jgi:hypothetical protein
LRPKIEVGRILSGVFRTYREQAGLLLPAALVVFIPVEVINGLLPAATQEPQLLELLAIGAVAVAVSLVGGFLYQGMVVEAARDMRDGRRDFSIGSLFSSVTPVLVTLIVAGVLAGFGVGLGLILLVVPGLVLLTWWALLAPVIVIERAGVFEAFGRSRALVRGNGWPVFGVIVVLVILQIVVAAVLQAVAGAAGGGVAGASIATLIANVLLAPLSALAAATMFFELSETPAGAPE